MERLIFGGPVDWASLIAGSKFTVLVLFYFAFEGNFPSTNPRRGGGRAYIWKGLYVTGEHDIRDLLSYWMEAWGFNILHAIWFLKPSLVCSFVRIRCLLWEIS